MYTIIVNAKEKKIDRDKLSYVDIVAMTDFKFSIGLTVIYSRPPLCADDGPKEGSLHFFDPPINIRDKMIFTVAETSNA
ncbi:MAG: hypothetical protein KGN01_05805 [Patescibacteria group bacterium]|nr:hypothetical protein [Patescibacteria group bacterium]